MPAIAWLAAGGSAFCFALALILTQFGLRHLPAMLGAAISMAASTTAFWVLAPKLLSGDTWIPTSGLIFAAVGVLFPAAVTLLTFESNKRMGPTVAGSLGNLAPLFAILAAVIILDETLSWRHVAGVATIVIGVTVMSSRGGSGASRSWPTWVVTLPLLAAAIRGGVQPAVKFGLLDWHNPFAAVLIGYTVSSAVVITAITLRDHQWPRRINKGGFVWFSCVGLCNGLAVLLLYTALSLGPVVLVSPTVAGYPLITLLLSLIFLRTSRPTWRQAIGVAMTVIGVAGLLISNK